MSQQLSKESTMVDKTVQTSITIPESLAGNIWDEVNWNIANNGGFKSFSSVLTKRLREAKMFVIPNSKKNG